jgi:hypothetical protein
LLLSKPLSHSIPAKREAAIYCNLSYDERIEAFVGLNPEGMRMAR